MYDLDLGQMSRAKRSSRPSVGSIRILQPDAMVLMGNFAGEADRTPDLLEILREHAVEPRITPVENVLMELQERGAVRDDIDKHTIATMCFGSYFAAFYRSERKNEIPEAVVAVLWPTIANT
ncbi:MAG TPA: TetR/AcrR family transcriptional regulator C-terminal ligand-binding domain-containing protein [Streptosporangiaceae bacterium]